MNQNANDSHHIKDIQTTIEVQRDCIYMLDAHVSELSENSRKFTDFLNGLVAASVQPHRNSPQQIKSLAREIQERMARLINLVVYNLLEVDENTDSDQTRVAEILRNSGIMNPNPPARRVGRATNGRPRALIVTLFSRTEVLQVLRNLQALPRDISISEDRTKQEREIYNELRQQVQQHNNEHPNEPWHLKYVHGLSTLSAQSRHFGRVIQKSANFWIVNQKRPDFRF